MYLPTVVANINLGILYILAVSSLEVYGVIIAGWASKSNYAFLGALRSACQIKGTEAKDNDKKKKVLQNFDQAFCQKLHTQKIDLYSLYIIFFVLFFG